MVAIWYFGVVCLIVWWVGWYCSYCGFAIVYLLFTFVGLFVVLISLLGCMRHYGVLGLVATFIVLLHCEWCLVCY